MSEIKMSEIKELIDAILAFRDERDWKQFHNPKDSAIALVSEAMEVLEHFKWKSKEEMEKYVKRHKKEIGDELSDVLYWVLLMSEDLSIDIKSAFYKKMKENEIKYPIKKSKGKHSKYNKL